MNQSILSLDILFIEDTIDDAELAVHNLNKDGFSVYWQRVDKENELRDVLSSWKPDVILSDYSMPGFSGHAALKICQELEPDIPFIFLSGTIGEERAIEAIHNGATDYVLKENMKRLSPAVTRAVNDSLKRRQALEVEKERSRLIAILEATSDFVGIVHPNETLIYLNQGGRKLLNLEEHAAELSLQDILPRQQLKSIREHMWATDTQHDTWQNDSLLLANGGAEIPVSQVAIIHRDQGQQPEYYSFIARDIRDRKAYEEKIRYLANYDPLTEMPNRTLLADRVTQAIHHSQWTKRSLAILTLDIDRFKHVNDGYGHEFGDTLLKSFANRLRSTARPRDTIARISADCFAVLATELASPEDVIILISKLQKELTTPFEIKGHSLSVNVGIGVSVYPRDGNSCNTLMRNADVAMHRLKESGNSGFQFYTSEMTNSASDRVHLETELHHALSRNQLELHYQIQVNLAEQRIVGVEALMRWKHPVRGMVSPGTFIPIAENSDLICSMGEWALVAACKQLKEWDQLCPQRLRMAVNVSVRQFRSKGFPELVKQILESLDLEPARLELEITESLLVQDQEEVAEILARLNKLGVRISLDDFGTGYSNLSYLSRLPIHALKIDQSFVQRSGMDKSDMEIVRAIISLADSLGLDVIAEGIETQEQFDLLCHYKCKEGQGYFLSRPQPAQEIPALLNAGPIFTPNQGDTDQWRKK